MVTLAEIEKGGDLWASDNQFLSFRKSRKCSKLVFVRAARLFLGFHGMLDLEQPPQPFGDELTQYLQVSRDQRGLASTTLKSHAGHVGNFLKWISHRTVHLSMVAARDVADYLTFKRTHCTALTVATASQPLRSFLAYAEMRGWCSSSFRELLICPKRRRYDPDITFPTWAEVRRVLDEDFGNRHVALRNRAILLLCSIYGFRSSEVSRLRLGDLDWRGETITITRSKSSRTQQYPLQFEVGEAILAYLAPR